MKPFLYEVAEHLYRTHGEGLSGCVVICPNRRPSVFLKNYLSGIITRPMWSPDFLTITEYIEKLSNLRNGDRLEMLFDLYEVFTRTGKTREPFDEFYMWGDMLLNDFDDVDKYLVDPRDLFRNLAELKSIEDRFDYLEPEQIEVIREFWRHFDIEQFSRQKSAFISVWEILYRIYTEFKKILERKSIGYEGMIYRKLAGDLENPNKKNLPYTRHIFIGFNALNACEEKIFRILKNLGRAEFYWDYDEYYLKREHKAGFFISRYSREFPSEMKKIKTDHLSSGNTKIRVISVPSGVAQARMVTEIIPGLQGSGEEQDIMNRTCIVLADENLLMPLLHALPGEQRQINVTMGYPFRNTPVYGLFEHIIELQGNLRGSQEGTLFHYREVLAILNHQYIQSRDEEIVSSLNEDILRTNRMYVPQTMMEKGKVLPVIFRKINSLDEMPDYFLGIIRGLIPEEDDQKVILSRLDREYIYQLYTVTRRLLEIINQKDIALNVFTFLRIFRKVVRNMRIPFTGEPLAGIQIMGVLETRALDFQNIIVLSMNEGNFPRTTSNPSFVPYSLRRGFGMPTIEHQDSVYAYYFYRLLQRAREAVFIYDNRTEGLHTGEKSRFIYQLQFDPRFNTTESVYDFTINTSETKEIVIEKSQAVMQELEKYTDPERGEYISPSAMNDYLDCPLRFYFRKIANLTEPDKVTENIDQGLFGKLMHAALEHSYKPFVGKTLTKELIFHQLIKNKNRITEALNQAFSREYFHSSTISRNDIRGNNLLIADILQYYLQMIFNFDAGLAPFEIESLERKCTASIPVVSEGIRKKLLIGGRIDRIDHTKEGSRIVDYKTGKPPPASRSLEDLFTRGDPKRDAASFQAFFYAYIFGHDLVQTPVVPALYYLRGLHDKGYEYRLYLTMHNRKFRVHDFAPIRKDYEKLLCGAVSELMDPEIPFRQVEDRDMCSYCPYRMICHRE